MKRRAATGQRRFFTALILIARCGLLSFAGPQGDAHA
jgi:chromate transport protein ChrA